MNTPSTPDQNLEHFSNKDIFSKIWVFPRAVFRFIEAKKLDEYVYILLILNGICNAFDRAVDRNLGDHLSLGVIILGCVLLGGLLGWISLAIYAALLSWTGKWVGGQADSKSLLRVLAYGTIPSIVASIFLIPQIGIYGIALFQQDGDITGGSVLQNVVFWGAMFLEVVLAIWSFIITLIGVSEIQQISILKAFLNLLLPILIFVVPLLIIAGIFSTL